MSVGKVTHEDKTRIHYIDPEIGDDIKGSGTIDKPYKTLGKAFSTLSDYKITYGMIEPELAKYPSCCCQECGEQIGFIGKLFNIHKCKKKPEITVEQAIEKIVRELKEDSRYYTSWKANIAMAFQDEAVKQKSRDSRKKLHEIANMAADNFLKLLMKDGK